ncbi:MAG TPA: PQQ-dependent sugar dehydrogenase [Chitinophagaceae bacterium]|nr:PQQ-dependent sugar dehydrogenase [Chitinophagaceae bacterium]
MALQKHNDDGFDLEEGYELKKLIGGLTYPSNLEFGPNGEIYIAEAGFTYPFIYTKARISRLEGKKLKLIGSNYNGPLIGLHYHDDGFLVTHRGVLSWVGLNGKKNDLVTDLPSFGDHHTNHIVVKDNKIYFGQGTMTNTGIVGSDNLLIFGWLANHKKAHDIPPFDVVLSGTNFESRNPFNPLKKIQTGPFLPIGTPAKKGQVIKGQLKSNGVIYRCNLDGTDLEVYAWGLRNPYALTTDAEGRIFVIVHGEDARGSRPAEAPDCLYEVKQGGWYGWPDFSAGRPLKEFMQSEDVSHEPVLQNHPVPEKPLHAFEEHGAAVSIDFSSNNSFGFVNEAFVAEYGSEAPFTTGGKFIFPGHKIVRLNMRTMVEEDFYVKTSKIPGMSDGPERPVYLKFSPDGTALYILDHGVRTLPKTGALWQITKSNGI